MPKTLTRAIVHDIKRDLAASVEDEAITQRRIAERYDVDQSTISRIATGRAWNSVPWPGAFTPTQPIPENPRKISSGNKSDAVGTDENLLESLLGQQGKEVHDVLTAAKESPTPHSNDEHRAREDQELRDAVSLSDEEDEDE